MANLYATIDHVLMPTTLFLVMLSIGAGLRLGDFHRVSVSRRAFLLGFGSMVTLVPAAGVLIALVFGSTPAITLGLVLLATCPSGILSNMLTDMAKGDVALSISISIALSLAYIVSLPAVLQIMLWVGFLDKIGAANVSVAALSKIMIFTLLPLALGMLVRARSATLADQMRTRLRPVAAVILMALFAALVAREKAVLWSAVGPLALALLLFNAVNLAIAVAVGHFGRLTRAEKATIRVEHLIRQEGTATFVAISILGVSEASLPLIANTALSMIAALGLVWQRKVLMQARLGRLSPLVRSERRRLA